MDILQTALQRSNFGLYSSVQYLLQNALFVFQLAIALKLFFLVQ